MSLVNKSLVVVESPAKTRTIKKYLGKNYTILASYGHVRSLPSKPGAVNPDENFAMVYQLLDKNAKYVDEIEKALSNVDNLLLATDPDREGEAISWHIYNILESRGKLQGKKVERVIFHEITKKSIKKALTHPRELNMNLVDAQKARQALDYLIGFNLSPLLWKKIRFGLSAGRVQSPALRLIVEREQQIQTFKIKEYWSIMANVQASDQVFDAKLIIYDKEKLEQFSINNQQQAEKIKDRLIAEAKGQLEVASIDRKQRRRHPAAPFITSTMQQEAFRKLGFTAQRTMSTAQKLYESGLITYMRTDSTNLASDALEQIRQLITTKYGEKWLSPEVRRYKTKTKNAQEAHEAIRPTQADNTPETLKLDRDQQRLYTLIWQRTVACQMVHATINMVAVTFRCGKDDYHVFRTTGSMIAHLGFILVYQESKDDGSKEDERGGEDTGLLATKAKQAKKTDTLLPDLKVGQKVALKSIDCKQHFTEPPPRYSEASLIKTLEEHGIGRPSTYASIISTLKTREYVVLLQKRFKPTDVGCFVNKFLTKFFTVYVDYGFTANLEDQLDAISRGENEWKPLLQSFWYPFKKQVDEIMNTVDRSQVVQEKIDEQCPKCNSQLVSRLGRGGVFIACSGYPECTYTRSVDGDDSKEIEVSDRSCPKCGKMLQVKHGRYGKFLACPGYPDCKHIESLEKPKDTGVVCPKCSQGTILEKKSRRGKIFYACSCYPKCQYAVWDLPIKESCPKCQWPMLVKKTTKSKGEQIMCPNEGCKYISSAKDN